MLILTSRRIKDTTASILDEFTLILNRIFPPVCSCLESDGKTYRRTHRHMPAQ
jgi:hypothetical protein